MQVRPPLPTTLQVEVTAACNLRCRMCLVRYRPPVDRVTGTMSLADFRRVLDDVPGVRGVTLQGLGEPLLVPHLVDMVREATSRDIAVGFNTNATLLTRSKADALIDAGLTWICVSLDGASAATYEGIRDGARFARVATNAAALVSARRAAAATHPDIALVFVAMRRNLAELPDVVRLGGRWGVDRVKVQNLSHSFDDVAGEAGYEAIRAFTAGEALWDAEADVAGVFAAARLAADDVGVALHLPKEPGPATTPVRAPGTPGCTWPWDSGYVTHDADVQPCCMVMGTDRARFGSARDEGFAAAWSSDTAAGFRAALLSDEPPEVCRGCSLYNGRF